MPTAHDGVPPGGWDRPIEAPPAPGVPAGWASRAVAAIVDTAIVGLPAAAFAASLVALAVGAGLFAGDDGASVALGVVAVLGIAVATLIALLIVTLLYAPFLMRRRGPRNGQTWGKQLMGIRVIRRNGDPQTLASAAFREGAVKVLGFALAASLLLYVPTLLDCLWPAWDREKRALHDMLADSRVVRA